MASRFVLLPRAAEYPASGQPQLTVNNRRPVLAYDASTLETAYWTTILPQGWTGTVTAYILFIMATATTGAIRMQVAMESITPGDSVDLDSTTSFDTTNNSGNITVPGTAGFPGSISITLTNHDASAAGDYVRFQLDRDAANAGDTAAGDVHILGMEIRDGA